MNRLYINSYLPKLENKIQIYKANRSGRGEMAIAIMGALFFSVIMGCLFDWIVGLVTIFLSIILILIKRKKIGNSHDEVFYMNRKFIKCLALDIHNLPVSISVIILMLLFPVFLVKYLNTNGKKK